MDHSSLDPFEADYTAGVLRADRAPARPADTAEGVPVREFALAGCVLTSDRALTRGFVRLGGPTIGAISDAPPTGVEPIETDGVILPGLVDLHGHPEYNVFAPWEPPVTYANRGDWRDSPEYERLVKAPYREFKAAKLVPTLTRYAEIRALVGGVSTIERPRCWPKMRRSRLRTSDSSSTCEFTAAPCTAVTRPRAPRRA